MKKKRTTEIVGRVIAKAMDGGRGKRAGQWLHRVHAQAPWLTRRAARLPGGNRLVGALMLLGRTRPGGRARIPEKGLPKEAVLGMLALYKGEDIEPHSGRVWAYIYDAGPEVEEVCKQAFTMFLLENALDPTVYPSVMALENELVEMAKGHVSAGREVVGNFTSGGTESIILAVKAARDWARAERPRIREPEIILPVTAHAAFQKAAEYLCVKPVRVDVNRKTFRADVNAIREAITPNTILLVGSAPSYAHGVVDPIREIGALAIERKLLFHVDACVGGFLLHYLRRLGVGVPEYDFSVPGVTSLSMDLHKYGFTAKGASIILYRDKQLRRFAIFSYSGWTGYTIVNPTIQSSRGGGPLAAAWAVMNFLGEEGYLKLAREMHEGTRRLVDGVATIPDLHVMGRPDMNLVAVASDTVSVFHVADEMRERGWYVQPQLGLEGFPENIHFSVAAGNVPHVDAMLKDLAASTEAAKRLSSTDLAERVRKKYGRLKPEEVTERTFQEMLAMAGIRGVNVPKRMAEINEVLNALPPALADRLLAGFFNDLNQALDES